MSEFKKVNREALKQAVNKDLGNVASKEEVVIVSARKIKDGRLELEFAQSRKLRNGKTSVVDLLNASNDRFNLNNKQVVRVWQMITLEGAQAAFGFSFEELNQACEGLTKDERIMVMWDIKKYYAEGKEYNLNIRVRETTDIAKLPKSMREDIESGNEYPENHKLLSPTGPNNELEPVVDEKGNFVYRWNELDYNLTDEKIEDELIQGKIPLSIYNNYKVNTVSESYINNEKVFITLSNLKRITRKTKSDVLFEGELHHRPIYFFSEFEKKKLLSIKSFIGNPNNFIDNYYSPILTEDSRKYVFEEGSPAYHKRSDCERLNSNFTNFEIPIEIKEKGDEKINEFRKWFKENLYLLNDPSVFTMRLNLKFGINKNPKSIEFDNRGISEFENLNLYLIPSRIDKLIFKAADFYNSSSIKEQNIIKNFSKRTYLAFSNTKIEDNNSGLSDTELKAFLREYDVNFKKPIRNLIVKKFVGEANEDLKFDSTLLDKLGFKPCKNCCD